MRDMRNTVIHAYFAVDFEIVWRTVQEDLPKLKEQVDHLLNQRQSDRYHEHIPGYDPPQTESMRQPDPDLDRDDELEPD
jgi:hypothetical protein